MNDAEMINQSSYRRAFRYLRSSVYQGSSYVSGRAGASRANGSDRDLEAIGQLSQNTQELVLFPSYARFVTEDKKILDIRIHGWLYTPVPDGKPSRRNRYTMLLARSIAGLPALPDKGSTSLNSDANATPDVAAGKYPERDDDSTSFAGSESSAPPTPGVESATSGMPSLSKQSSLDDSTYIKPLRSRQGSELSSASDFSTTSNRFSRHFVDHDLITCHANLASRMHPFLAKPIVGKTVKVDVYADDKFVFSEDLITGDNGHFRGSIEMSNQKLDLDKVTTLEARIADTEHAHGTTGIRIVKDAGVSVISDMDDTVKHTDIVAGMREAFRNAFVRDLASLEVPGVRGWYSAMQQLGCPIHYVSNAPYQMWPCLARFIKIVSLPIGTIHLKQYSGMIQGLFEPAAEKKRANVTRILLDFPNRKFILVGDSGEQDLELYTELAQSAFAAQILGIFIRDVSSGAVNPEDTAGESGEAFFSAGAGDNTVDNVAPPGLPARPGNITDLLGLDTGADRGKHSAKPSINMYDMLSLNSAIPSTDSLHVAAPEPELDQVVATKNRPAVPRKPTGLRRLLTRTEDGLDASKAPPSPLTSTSSISSTQSAPIAPAPARRPGLLRSVSSGSNTLTEAQKMSNRVARARSLLPQNIKLYIWRNGGDCQQHAEELIRNALKSTDQVAKQ